MNWFSCETETIHRADRIHSHSATHAALLFSPCVLNGIIKYTWIDQTMRREHDGLRRSQKLLMRNDSGNCTAFHGVRGNVRAGRIPAALQISNRATQMQPAEFSPAHETQGRH